jgi:hypothetical protein
MIRRLLRKPLAEAERRLAVALGPLIAERPGDDYELRRVCMYPDCRAQVGPTNTRPREWGEPRVEESHGICASCWVEHHSGRTTLELDIDDFGQGAQNVARLVK